MTDDRSQPRHGPGGVGASSGREQLAQERTVPGTASAREGYQSEPGTATGTPLKDIGTTGTEQTTDTEQQEISAADDGDQPEADRPRDR
ncbi:hypothetical protein [Kitasatospora purpeofusca]|uniref:hypothetical protein n=1 Tax=Kitasatospora purpeofusca TaxID=67352 RepID=UPI002A5AF250|nr:hypothetical protein [Kitasatospora purpeofusca]MDY0812701.1 hypothetical protein [Kitasatospora purpeofusca]